MASRAIWKGFIKVAEITCPVAMYTAASTTERIAFHTLNRATGHRVHRQYVDDRTGKPVEAEDQVKGYETTNGTYVVLEPEEVASAIPDSDKTLDVGCFIGCGEVDDLYFDRPYYLLPGSPVAEETFALLRDGMRETHVAAIAHAVLFRRLRAVLIRAHHKGLIATTLNFNYEVRSAEQAFAEIPDIQIQGEMLDLARHIIGTKAGHFDPKSFDDRYEAALAELVKAKLEGRKVVPLPKPAAPTKPNDLLEALRQSAGASGGGKGATPAKKAAAKKPAARKSAARKASPATTPHRKAG